MSATTSTPGASGRASTFTKPGRGTSPEPMLIRVATAASLGAVAQFQPAEDLLEAVVVGVLGEDARVAGLGHSGSPVVVLEPVADLLDEVVGPVVHRHLAAELEVA